MKSTPITWKDTTTNLEWTTDKSYLYHTYEIAIDYPKDELEDETWHLATTEEFFTLLDHTNSKPAFKKGVPIKEFDTYWTSTEYVLNPNRAWNIDTKDGIVRPASKTNQRRVLFCRPLKENKS